MLHSPYFVSNPADNRYLVPVLEYDKGIRLTPTTVNGDTVLWRWEGETVDMGTQYQLWGGDTMIVETTGRTHEIPATECNRYQVVKLRVLVKAGADHPRAGQWSFFSLPAEAYVGPDGPMTQEAAVGKYF